MLLQETQAINLELSCLAVIHRETGLPVPEPLISLDGRRLLTIEAPTVGGVRSVSLLR